MIGDKRYTEALDAKCLRVLSVVEERSWSIEAGRRLTVEFQEVSMQT